MKKILFIFIAMLLACFNAKAQVWSCDEFQTDLNTYNELNSKYKSSGNKKWAKNLIQAFPLAEDGTIKFQYVIKSSKEFNAEDIHNTLLSWYKIKNIVPTGNETRMSGFGILQNVGRYVGYMNATFISAKSEITIEIKENKIRVTASVLNYIGANTWNGAETILPSGCFPAVPDGKQKDSHAMAYINCVHNLLTDVASIMKHLNDNVQTIENGDEDW